MFRVIILIVALTAGGSAAFLALSMRPTNTVVQPAPHAPMQDVLVASSDVAQGQALMQGSMRWQPWPEGMLNGAYITRSARPDAIENLAGSVLRSRVASGEPILQQKLVPLNSGFLSAMLPPGKRAVAVRISAESTAGGFILPNDRVDVIHTVDEQGEGQMPKISRTILRNVLVLAIDQTIDEAGKDGKGSDANGKGAKGKDERAKSQATVLGKTATLELDPLQAEILAAAEAKGRLSLALRSAADNGEVPTVSREPTTHSVRIIRAGRTEITKMH